MERKELSMLDFTKSVRNLFTLLSLNKKKLVLNGSFKSSYFATDIDLWEPVSKRSAKRLSRHIQGLVNADVGVSAVKVFSPEKKTYERESDLAEIEQILLKARSADMIKVDVTVKDVFPFPIECTIIFDFKPKESSTSSSVTAELMEDIEKYRKEGNLVKVAKRMLSVAIINKLDDLAEKIKTVTEDSVVGVLNLSRSRLELLKEDEQGHQHIDADERKRIREWIDEDLRKVGATRDSLDKMLSSRVSELMAKLEL